MTDMMVILESRDEVDAFASTAQLSLGTAMGMAAGSMGRSAKAGIHTGERANSVAAIFTYSKSRGLYLGMSVDAAFMMSRPDLNRNFYGKDVNEQILLNGQ